MKGLCYRCEYRAQFKEEGHAPRYECGEDGAKSGCYMYKPVKPCIVLPDKNDSRPQHGPPIISSRSYYVDESPKMVLKLKKIKDKKSYVYWIPEE